MGNGSSELRQLVERVARLEIRLLGLEAEMAHFAAHGAASDGGASAAASPKAADDASGVGGKKRKGA